MPRAGSHKSAPLGQDTIYGCPLASRDDEGDKKIALKLLHSFKGESVIYNTEMQTEVLLGVINPFIPFPTCHSQ